MIETATESQKPPWVAASEEMKYGNILNLAKYE